MININTPYVSSMEYLMALMQQWFVGKKQFDKCDCDICGVIFEQATVVTRQRTTRKLANGRFLCKACTKCENNNNRAAHGIIALSKISTTQRKINASKAGKASALTYDSNINKSRFSTERWNEKTPEQKILHIKRASDALALKLTDPIFAAQYYAKIFKQTKIGYISKGHNALHECIRNLGFESHVQIGSMQVDECNLDIKLVIEYNGDYWHCNPTKFKATDYNKAIKMTAGEKWNRDIARYSMLKKLGYVVVVVWESDWILHHDQCLTKIKKVYNEIIEKNNNTQPNML